LNNKTKAAISWKKRIFFIFFNLCILFFIFFLSAEIFIRSKGYKPFFISKPDIQVEPGGKYYRKDKDLGYTHLPGTFKVTLQKQFSFVTTHKGDTLRITHPPEEDTNFLHKEKIWIMGCSITHGWTLNDNETYPWLVQEKIPEYEIINFGVSGYGTIHSLIQIQNALKIMQKPKIIILTYASFHDSRNTFSKARRRIVSAWNFLGTVTQPYAYLDKNRKLVLHRADKVVYSPWPFARYSAFINYLEQKYIIYESRQLNPHLISKLLIKKINNICKEENITLIVAGIKENPQKKMKNILKFCNRLNIPTVDISVDLSKREYNNLPIDAHPNALANQKYAEKLFMFLKENNFLIQTPSPSVKLK
jgi:lysophospholipase L1-like esterase